MSELTDVIEYTKFLLIESNISDKPPIDLNKIHERFGIPYPQEAPLPNQQGVLVEINGFPQILLKDGDHYVRQRFTQAHELIELLLKNQSRNWKFNGENNTIFGNNKERICQIGAAHLLMPQNSFRPKVLSYGISLNTGKKLAELYEVSLTAALFRIVDQYPNSGAVLLCRLKNKPTEISNKITDEQMALPGFKFSSLPPKKLRIKWVYGKYKNQFIPNNKSIP